MITPKQNAFALKYVEFGTASEAYRTAYDVSEDANPEGIWVNASKTLSDANVTLRMVELQEAAQERTLVTVAGQTKRLQDLSKQAEHKDSESGINAAINAEKEVNKLNGLITEKRDLTSKGEKFDTMPLPWEKMYDDTVTSRDIETII